MLPNFKVVIGGMLLAVLLLAITGAGVVTPDIYTRIGGAPEISRPMMQRMMTGEPALQQFQVLTLARRTEELGRLREQVDTDASENVGATIMMVTPSDLGEQTSPAGAGPVDNAIDADGGPSGGPVAVATPAVPTPAVAPRSGPANPPVSGPVNPPAAGSAGVEAEPGQSSAVAVPGSPVSGTALAAASAAAMGGSPFAASQGVAVMASPSGIAAGPTVVLGSAGAAGSAVKPGASPAAGGDRTGAGEAVALAASPATLTPIIVRQRLRWWRPKPVYRPVFRPVVVKVVAPPPPVRHVHRRHAVARGAPRAGQQDDGFGFGATGFPQPSGFPQP